MTLHCQNVLYVVDEMVLQLFPQDEADVSVHAVPDRLEFPSWWCARENSTTMRTEITHRFAEGLPAGHEVFTDIPLQDVTETPMHGQVSSSVIRFHYALGGNASTNLTLQAPEAKEAAGLEAPLLMIAFLSILGLLPAPAQLAGGR